MLSKVRKRMTYTNIVVTLALVFVMTGGAYAANRYVITSTKQVSPKVVSALKGKAGPAGAKGLPGPVGPVGPTGPTGAKGEIGATGNEGVAGKEGAKGENGKQGIAGKEGSPWTASGILPSGKTEYGTWSDYGNTENGKRVAVPVAFTLPVENAQKEAPLTEFVYATQQGAHCKGTATEPSAPAGYLCVYDALPEETVGKPTFHVQFISFLNPAEGFQGPKPNGASSVGTLLQFETTEIGSGGLPFTDAYGPWAVTAE